MTVPQGGAGGKPPEQKKPTIVVVDDDEITLTATAETLERAGYRVLTRNRPAGCVAMILQEKPDLVLLDVCMPTVSGDTLVKLFSKASPNSQTVILLYSALDEPLLRSKAKAAGAHGYITKNGDTSHFVRAVKRWLRSPLAESRFGVPAEPAAPEKPARSDTSSSRWRLDEQPLPRYGSDIGVTVSGEIRRAPVGTPTVLFVDDDMLVLSGYRRQLLGQPFEFEFAISGGQAQRQLTSPTPPAVIVADLMMPKPDGAALLTMALDEDQNWSRRFIVVTALSNHDAKLRLDRRFFGAVLRKPVETDDLVNAIRGSLLGAGLMPSLQREAKKTAGR